MAVVTIKSNTKKIFVLLSILLVSVFFIGLSFRRFRTRKVDRILLSVKNATSNLQDRNCTLHTCFEVSLCSLSARDKIGVYIYDEPVFVDNQGNQLNVPYSIEYEQLVQAVKFSSYHQSNFSKACLFIPPIDTLSQIKMNTMQVSRNLASLPG